jgi:hypothetical protein
LTAAETSGSATRPSDELAVTLRHSTLPRFTHVLLRDRRGHAFMLRTGLPTRQV